MSLETPRAFLGVTRSVLGRPWRDRLDAAGLGRAEALAQIEGMPDILAHGRWRSGDELDAIARDWLAVVRDTLDNTERPIAVALPTTQEGVALLVALSSLPSPVILLPPDVRAWRTEPADAEAESRSTGRPLLIAFSADWCMPCRQLESSVLSASAWVRGPHRRANADPWFGGPWRRNASELAPACRGASTERCAAGAGWPR